MITQELLEDLRRQCGSVELKSPQDLDRAIRSDKAIFYLSVDWSGPERVSRYIIFNILVELSDEGIPVFIVDPSEMPGVIENWLMAQCDKIRHFRLGGWGETLLVSKGKLVDHIDNPAQLGKDGTREIIRSWLQHR